MKNRQNSRRVLTVVLISIALTLVALQGLHARQPDGAYEWVMTPEAAIRTAQGECYVEGATVQEVCVQWCVISHDGDILPQNRFECMPFN